LKIADLGSVELNGREQLNDGELEMILEETCLGLIEVPSRNMLEGLRKDDILQSEYPASFLRFEPGTTNTTRAQYVNAA
jgi:hypothetical protein